MLLAEHLDMRRGVSVTILCPSQPDGVASALCALSVFVAVHLTFSLSLSPCLSVSPPEPSLPSPPSALPLSLPPPASVP